MRGNVALQFAAQFTLQSLKATLLTYANLHGVAPALRAAQGHHKVASNRCVDLYGRNDISAQLECQSGSARRLAPQVPQECGLLPLIET